MQTELKVKYRDEDVAAVVWDATKGTAVFEYYDSFLQKQMDIAPITMPLSEALRGNKIFSFPALRGKTFKGLPGLLADSLPDDYGNSIIDEWFASKGLSEVDISPIDRLCYIGKRGMGALEFEPATQAGNLDKSSKIEIELLTELALEVLNKRELFSAKIELASQPVVDILKVGTSAGGAKPKAIIAYNDTTKEIRSGQVKAPDGYSYWLLKFDGVENKKLGDNPLGIGRIEYAYYKMAVDSGIEMTESRILEEGKYGHFITKRFDRLDNGDKIHIQTFCGMAHFDRDGQYSYEQLFQVMRLLFLPYPDMEQMYRRMVFNVIARNHDDHTKNHALILNEQGSWRLSPAYDICYAFSPSGQWTARHQLSVNNKRADFEYGDLVTVAKNMGIKKHKEIIEQIISVVSQWKKYASEANVQQNYSEQIYSNLRLKL